MSSASSWSILRAVSAIQNHPFKRLNLLSNTPIYSEFDRHLLPNTIWGELSHSTGTREYPIKISLIALSKSTIAGRSSFITPILSSASFVHLCTTSLLLPFFSLPAFQVVRSLISTLSLSGSGLGLTSFLSHRSRLPPLLLLGFFPLCLSRWVPHAYLLTSLLRARRSPRSMLIWADLRHCCAFRR